MLRKRDLLYKALLVEPIASNSAVLETDSGVDSRVLLVSILAVAPWFRFRCPLRDGTKTQLLCESTHRPQGRLPSHFKCR